VSPNAKTIFYPATFYYPPINYLVDPNGGLKQVIIEFLNAVMQYEAYLQSGALPYERGPQRKAHRNGTRPRTLKTHVGEITLDKPQFMEFPFETKVLERYSRVEQALLMTIDRFRFALWNHKAYPKAYWKRLRTTNVIVSMDESDGSKIQGRYEITAISVHCHSRLRAGKAVESPVAKSDSASRARR
jgi:transposase-like protein